MVIFRACEPELPTTTLPKLMLVGLSESAAWVPLPAREATVGESCALLFIETVPAALPDTVGANCALKVLDCPGAKESGKLNPLMLKPAPVTLPAGRGASVRGVSAAERTAASAVGATSRW